MSTTQRISLSFSEFVSALLRVIRSDGRIHNALFLLQLRWKWNCAKMTILEYLACGFTNGFGIYECSNSRRLLFRSIYAPVASLIAFFTGGFGIVEIVDNSNLLLVVGGGKRPFMSPNKVILWDDAKARFVGELEVTSKILSVRATKSEYASDSHAH